MEAPNRHPQADTRRGVGVLPSEWELRVASGQGAGTVLVVPVTGGTLGSGPACTLVLPDASVASEHLRFGGREDGSFWWEQVGEQSPTLLDGSPARGAPLFEGARLQLGAVQLLVLRRRFTGAPLAEDGPPPLGEELLAPGTLLAERYRIEDLIGQGGMGTVYRAEHLTLHKPFAIKVLRTSMGAQPEVVARFQREAVAASQIRHPNIVDVVDFGRTAEGRFYCVMEYLEGETLARRVAREGVLAPAEAARIGQAIAGALAEAHARGICHRDIKPENVLLVGTEGVKLLDFGIARLVEGPRDPRETAAGLIFGTPQYMSPEQASGAAQDFRSDVYSLGVVLHELLAGTPPYTGASATHVLAAHLLQPVPRLPETSARGDIPRGLADLVQQMMAKSAAERPERMVEVAERIEAALHAPVPRFTPRLRRALAAFAVILGALALVTAGFALRGRHAPRAHDRPRVTSAPVPPVAPGANPPRSPVQDLPTPSMDLPATAAPAPARIRTSGGVALPEPRVPPRLSRVWVAIESIPPGATVFIDGRRSGETPTRLLLSSGRPAALRLDAPGRRAASQTIRPRPGLVVSIHLAADTGIEDLKDSPY